MFLSWEPRKDHSRQIVVLMSGGVDSSITAHLLRADGWDVLGITMQIPVPCGVKDRRCCSADAAMVAGELGIPHQFIDVKEAFSELIIERFRQSYAQGQTPNPCVDCNTLLKFSLVWDFIRDEIGVDYLATGHYARVRKVNGRFMLSRAMDKSKDQSYFIYGVPAEGLTRFVLPLGELTKNEVRAIARELGLSVANKSESMELCFAGESDYRVVLSDEQVNISGDLTDMAGNKIGTHKGISNYTIGQRRGLGFAGGSPLYVGRIDPENNIIALCTREEVSFKKVKADQLNVLIAEEFTEGARLFGKIRSYGEASLCTVVAASKAAVTVGFDEPQFAPTPGQRLVLYTRDDFVVAGGTITL